MFRFFIDRPIFATVLAVLMTLAGALSVRVLSLSQYPNVTPPTIQVDCNYPGASSAVVAQTVAAPIEQRVNGVERMLYMNAQCTSDGTYTLTITFETGTDLNMAQVLVQNRVNLALPELPEVVRATGITARKRSPEILLTFALLSPDETYDQVYLSNYAVLHLKEVLTRVDGISDVTIFGQRDFSMRVWVNPDKLEARDLTVLDVVAAIRGQSAEVALGAVDGENGGSRLTVTSLGRLTDAEQFRDVVVKAGPDGQTIRVRDVADVEIGAKSNDVVNRFDRRQTVGLAIFLQPDANALATGEELKATMAALAEDFPPGITYELGYDTTPYIRASIDEVYKALRDSVILVAVVVMLFLQSWRSALIPLATVPVAVLGTFAALLLFGYGLNTLTLFGLVLAVGIVVDDAIVVVEAVQQQIEKGYAPREATLRAMAEVSGPVVAVGLVLAAVFVPCMFFPGIVGLFFKQFALTIAVSTLISTFNSLTLCPALCAILLKPKAARPDPPQRLINLLFGWFFWLFNRAFDFGGRAYTWGVGRLLRVALLVLVGYGGMLAFTGWWYRGAPLDKGVLVTPAFTNPFTGADVPAFDLAAAADNLRLPTGFIPEQDKGFLIASVQLPDAASAERTRAVIDKVAALALATPGIRHTNAVAGNSFVLSAYGSNFGSMFIILDPFDQRRERHSSVIVNELRGKIAARVPEAQINLFGASAVPGLGRAGGMRMMIQDRGEVGPHRLFAQTNDLVVKGRVQPDLDQVFSPFRVSAPQLQVLVSPAQCADNRVNPLDVYATMQATLGQRYVNDFNRFGRAWQVNVQATPTRRNRMEDVKRLKVRNAAGVLVPLRALCDVTEVSGPPVITRYNMYPAAAFTANVKAGRSSGEAIAVMEQLADDQLPRNMGYQWTELTFIEQRSRDTGVFVFVLAVAVVFLVLAALYESWALPFAVILVVPTCVLSSLVGVYLAQKDVNLFTQVGFVVLIGLACKNAILIVEYAKWKREAGADRRAAVLDACRQRLRPILMTSLAFILGVAPLAFATGAGAEMRTALGVAVFAGMIGVTAFGIFLTPVFYVVVDRLTEGRLARSPAVRRAGTVLRWAVAFGWVRPLIRRAGRK